MRKNVASQVVGCQLVNKTDGSPVTAGTTTVSVTGDNGTFTTGSVGSGAATHKGGGFWTYAPAQAETNYDHVAFTFANTSAVNATVQIYPSFPQTGDNYARLGAPAGASTAADIAAVKAVLPTALVSGRIDASVGAMAAGVLTATAIAADAITAAKVADGTIDAATFAAGAINAAAIAADAITDAKVAADVTIASVTGAVGSVTGAVGSVTGNVGGNVTGSVGSVATGGIVAGSFAAGAIDNAAIAADAIGSSELAATAASEIATAVRTELATELARVDVAVSTRLSSAGYTAPDNASITAIKAKTDNLPTDPADASDVAGAFSTVNSTLATIAGYVDTEVAAIKAKTDQLTFSTANRVDSQVFGMEAGTVTAAAIATDAIDADAIKTDAVTEIQSGLATAANLATVAGYVDTEVAAIKAVTDKLDTALELDGVVYRYTTNALEQAPTGGTAPTAADIADAVWDEDITGHLTASSTGAALNAAGSAGDPWATPLPGAYGAGTAGKIVGDNLDATTSSRASQSSVNTLTGYVDTEVAAIKAKTDNLPTDPADASDIAAAFATVNGKLDVIDDYIDTEVAAIKAKTDNLPASPAASTDAAAALAAVGVTTTITGRIDAAISSRLATAGYTAPDNADIIAIKAKTDNLPSDPADASDVAGAFSTVNSTLSTIAGYLDTEILAIKAKTDNLPSDPADASDIASALALISAAIADKTGYRLSATGVNDILRTALTEAYAAAGTPFTVEQALFMIMQTLHDRAIVGDILYVRKMDQSTNAMTFALDNGAAPTSQERSS